MDLQVVVLNLSYLLIAVGLTVREMLLLRSIILVSEGLITWYGYVAGNQTIVLWNALFMVINAARIVHLLVERRPVQVPREISDLYRTIFAGMSSREFLYFWNTGKRIRVNDELLCRENRPQHELMLILDGTVSIAKDGNEVARLQRGDFVAEMSFLTGDPASADAAAVGEVSCVVWSHEKLRQLIRLDRDLLVKLQVVLGRDLSKKLRSDPEPART